MPSDSFDELPEDVRNALEHAYASKYYDPVKAHEYYMRTRKLKGQSSASPKPTTAETYYSKEVEKKASISGGDKGNAAAKYKARNERLKTQAEGIKTQIREKLETLVNQIKADHEKATQSTAEEVQKNLMRVPKNASKRQRDAIVRYNAKLKADASRSIATSARAANKKISENRKAASEELTAVSGALRQVIAKYQTQYKKLVASKK